MKEGDIRKAYAKARRKSKWLKQFKCCDPLHDEHRWWGPVKNSTCRICREPGTIVPFDEIIGVGWFCCSAPCGRLFAGFCQQNIKSKCHLCNTGVIAKFVIPGRRASTSKKKNTHHCEICNGDSPCPIVEMCRKVE